MNAAVYIIKAAGRVKIGYSKNPWKRYRQLATGCPDPMILVATYYCRDAPDLEEYLHEKFADRREKGEWFRTSPEHVLLEIANRSLNSSGDVDLVLESDDQVFDDSIECDLWKDHWDTTKHGEIPENRTKATHSQRLVINQIERDLEKEVSEEDLREFFSRMQEMLDEDE